MKDKFTCNVKKIGFKNQAKISEHKDRSEKRAHKMILIFLGVFSISLVALCLKFF
jgi:hypothetical protein